MDNDDDYCCLGCRAICGKGECDEAEAPSPKGESGATGCSGAGCTQRLEPGVRGPAKILAEVRTFIEYQIDSLETVPEQAFCRQYTINEMRTILQYLESLSGTEPQDAA